MQPQTQKKWPEQIESTGLSFSIARQREVSSKPKSRSPAQSRGGIWSSRSRSFFGHSFVLFLSVFIDTKVLR